MIKLRLFRSIVQYAGIIMGSALFAMGYSWFLVPYKLVPGGVGGLGQIFYHLMGIPMGISMMAINIPALHHQRDYVGQTLRNPFVLRNDGILGADRPSGAEQPV